MTKRRRIEGYAGVAVLIFASALALVMLIGIGSVAVGGRPISAVGRDVLIALGGAMIGVVASYVGGSVGYLRQGLAKPPPPPPPPPLASSAPIAGGSDASTPAGASSPSLGPANSNEKRSDP